MIRDSDAYNLGHVGRGLIYRFVLQIKGHGLGLTSSGACRRHGLHTHGLLRVINHDFHRGYEVIHPQGYLMKSGRQLRFKSGFSFCKQTVLIRHPFNGGVDR